MENCIKEPLSSGHMGPSSYPVGAGFFFEEKKDKLYAHVSIFVNLIK